MDRNNLPRKPHVQKILLDMDGVLCDWVGGAISLFDKDRAEFIAKREEEPGYSLRTFLDVTDLQLWERIHEKGADFWANLNPYPWAYDLWVRCNSYAPTKICTTPGRWPTGAESHEGKIRWLEENLGCPNQGFYDAIPCYDKTFLAAPGVVLIDDRRLVLDPFIAAGGMGIHFPNPFEDERRSEAPHAMSAALNDLSDLVKFGEIR